MEINPVGMDDSGHFRIAKEGDTMRIPAMPTLLSQLSNDVGFITNSALSTYLLSVTAASTYSTQATVNGKFNTPAGSTSQYVRGDGSLDSFPSIPSAQIQSDWTQSSSGSVDFIKNKPAAISFNNAPGRSIVTGTGATGFQISATRNCIVNYSVTVVTNVQIGVATNVAGYLVLEICPTNSATAGDWVEIGRTGNGQNIGIALALASTQTTPGQIGGVVPSGYYAKLRSVNTNGTPTYAYNNGQEVLL